MTKTVIQELAEAKALVANIGEKETAIVTLQTQLNETKTSLEAFVAKHNEASLAWENREKTFMTEVEELKLKLHAAEERMALGTVPSAGQEAPVVEAGVQAVEEVDAAKIFRGIKDPVARAAYWKQNESAIRAASQYKF